MGGTRTSDDYDYEVRVRVGGSRTRDENDKREYWEVRSRLECVGVGGPSHYALLSYC